MPPKKKRSVTLWRKNETRLLIEIFGDDRIQAKLQGSRRNAYVFDEMTEKLKEHGVFKTGEQCRTKMKNLRALYKGAKDNNSRSGSAVDMSPFYDELDRLFTDRPTVAQVMHAATIVDKAIWERNRSKNWWDETVVGTSTDADWQENFRVSRLTFDYLCDQLRARLQR
ncbi:myb/SANT-like DNA-binding domain-containing protein 7 [Branchiostoma floridae x Branchiostoma belcheri]